MNLSRQKRPPRGEKRKNRKLVGHLGRYLLVGYALDSAQRILILKKRKEKRGEK